MNPFLRRRFAGAAIAILIIGALAALYFFDPAEADFLPPCPFRYLTGWECPGCGSLRAIHQLLRGRPLAALALNPLAVAAIPFVGLLLLRPGWAYRAGVPWTVLLVILAYWAARNLISWPG